MQRNSVSMDNVRVRAYAETQGIVPILGGEKRIGSTAGQDINFARGRDAPRLFVEGRRPTPAPRRPATPPWPTTPRTATVTPPSPGAGTSASLSRTRRRSPWHALPRRPLQLPGLRPGGGRAARRDAASARRHGLFGGHRGMARAAFSVDRGNGGVEVECSWRTARTCAPARGRGPAQA